jgi:lipopolysaccharide exporter
MLCMIPWGVKLPSDRTRSRLTAEAADRVAPLGEVVSRRLGSSLARRSVLGLILRLLSVALGLVSTVVIVRALGSQEFGLFTLGLAIAGVISQLADFGITQAVTRLSTQEPQNANHIASVAMTVRLLLTAVLGCLGVALALGVAGREGALVVGVLIATAPLSTASVLVGVANARMRPEFGPLLVAGQSFVWCLVCVVLAWLAPSPLSFAVGLAATVCVQSVATIIPVIGFHLPHKFELSRARQIVSVSWAPGVLGLFVTAYYRLDSIVIYHYADGGNLGHYGAAYKFIDTAQLLPGVLVAPLIPLMVRTGKRTASSERVLNVALRYALICGVGVAALLAGCGRWLLTTLYGREYAATDIVLTWLGLAFVGICLGYVGTASCMALGLVKKQILPVAALAVLSVLAQVWLIPRYGIVAAAASTAATEVAMAVIGLVLLRLHFDRVWRGVPLIRIAVCGAISATAGRLSNSGQWWSAVVTGSALVVLLVALQVLTRKDLNLLLRRSA